MNPLYAELQWLPRVPQEFSEKLKGLRNATPPLGKILQTLALHALDLNQLTKLAKVIVKERSEGKSLSPLKPFRLAMLSNSTVELVVPALWQVPCDMGSSLMLYNLPTIRWRKRP